MPRRIFGPSTAGDEYDDIGELLDLATSRPEWWADAACKEAPLSVAWFAARGQSEAPAKAVCSTCLVLEECRTWALEHDGSLQGVFGGLNQRERAQLRREQKAA